MVNESSYLAEINCFEEYLHFIKAYCKKNKCETWYRGQRTSQWKLNPNLYREAKMNIKSNHEISKLEYDFVNFKEEFFNLKKEILDKHLFDISKLNDFQVMFIAQHYGLLTPILDWTTDPLVALFFALDKYIFEEDSFPVIYILKPGLCNENSALVYSDKTNITEPICIDRMNKYFNNWIENLNDTPANHIPIAIFSKMDFSHRICRQSGKFTFHGALGPLNYSWNNIVIKNEKIVDVIKINPEAVDEIKEYIFALNITRQSIYRDISDLDNICEHLKEESLTNFKKNISKVNESFKK